MTTAEAGERAESPGSSLAEEVPTSEELIMSVVIPCLNEAQSIARCVEKASDAICEAGIVGEVVVVDNGSTDGSPSLALSSGARVVHEPHRGYGSACRRGLRAAQGKYVLMADADESYDFSQLGSFLALLEDGADVVMGSRLKGTIHNGAMPWLHRRVGNPLLTWILNLFFGAGVSDAHCGMRAFRRDLLARLDLRSSGMEFASEQVIRAAKLRLDIREVPIDYRRRVGTSKLSSFSDGWRHLRLLLVHSPTWLFLVPGLGLLVAGLLAGMLVMSDIASMGPRLHTLIFGSMTSIIGAQVIQLGLFARAYAVYHLGERDPVFDRVRERLRLEHGLVVGGALFGVGFALEALVLGIWIDGDFGELSEGKLAIAGLTLVLLGIQTIFGAFFLSILGLRRDRSRP